MPDELFTKHMYMLETLDSKFRLNDQAGSNVCDTVSQGLCYTLPPYLTDLRVIIFVL